MYKASIPSYTTRMLCSNKGALVYGHLYKSVREKYNISNQLFCELLKNGSRFVIVQGSEDKISGRGVSPDSKVIAKTSVRLCKDYPKDCGDCEGLHLCKYFVYGNCRFNAGSKCRFSHDLRSIHNIPVLRANQLQDLEDDELCQLLLQNDPSLLPEVCIHYNKGFGKFGACTHETKCTKLHICQHFMQGDCRFGSQCKRSHKFDGISWQILKSRGLAPDLIRNLPDIYQNIYSIRNSSTGESQEAHVRTREPSVCSNSDAEHEEICLFYIRKHCGFKDKCLKVHYHLPYKWEVLNGSAWTDLPDMEEIEKAFCNPANTTSGGSPVVDFLTMRRGSASVRRLSTASSVTKPPHFILTTDWAWYWQDEHRKWVEYGKQVETSPSSSEDVLPTCTNFTGFSLLSQLSLHTQASKHRASSVTSEALEKAFLADPDSSVPFSVGQQQYSLSFKDMRQQNSVYQTQRAVRRRPRFISARDVESKIKSKSDSVRNSTSQSVPSHWLQSAVPDFGYKLVLLSSSSEEFKQVQDLFQRTLPKSTIQKIERIQNLGLWEVFQWQKEQMKKKTGGKVVDERTLFHGTEKALLEAICQQNFDWRMCGVHGTAYGKGSYFARDASYSHNYAKTKDGQHIMFAAKVLVGEFTRGNSSFKRPPSKDARSTGLYDSCVDNTDNPSIFVIFEKHQIYPEYVIEYSNRRN
ncbi:protein mono-ADP-ribosyltransferase PARP12-like isoform X2 [Acipenser ruthenus]|uniref:protein mono-ADP-ribosyltransferase PARP12-like isoform X2 n=1 Tax=Acipenser ruthenus TaxID=7906 RepID=UPI00145AD611|nr:protein mono-ADP-ribosyltransferase PARP12-like isoform X2 [Acipenser ruthenus]